jgi:hypothetical protein
MNLCRFPAKNRWSARLNNFVTRVLEPAHSDRDGSNSQNCAVAVRMLSCSAVDESPSSGRPIIKLPQFNKLRAIIGHGRLLIPWLKLLRERVSDHGLRTTPSEGDGACLAKFKGRCHLRGKLGWMTHASGAKTTPDKNPAFRAPGAKLQPHFLAVAIFPLTII